MLLVAEIHDSSLGVLDLFPLLEAIGPVILAVLLLSLLFDHDVQISLLFMLVLSGD